MISSQALIVCCFDVETDTESIPHCIQVLYVNDANEVDIAEKRSRLNARKQGRLIVEAVVAAEAVVAVEAVEAIVAVDAAEAVEAESVEVAVTAGVADCIER